MSKGIYFEAIVELRCDKHDPETLALFLVKGQAPPERISSVRGSGSWGPALATFKVDLDAWNLHKAALHVQDRRRKLAEKKTAAEQQETAQRGAPELAGTHAAAH